MFTSYVKLNVKSYLLGKVLMTYVSSNLLITNIIWFSLCQKLQQQRCNIVHISDFGLIRPQTKRDFDIKNEAGLQLLLVENFFFFYMFKNVVRTSNTFPDITSDIFLVLGCLKKNYFTHNNE